MFGFGTGGVTGVASASPALPPEPVEGGRTLGASDFSGEQAWPPLTTSHAPKTAPSKRESRDMTAVFYLSAKFLITKLFAASYARTLIRAGPAGNTDESSTSSSSRCSSKMPSAGAMGRHSSLPATDTSTR